MDETSEAQRSAWRDAFVTYTRPTMLAMLILGFASGLPLMMVFSKLSYWLRDVGIERTVKDGATACQVCGIRSPMASAAAGCGPPVLQGV